MGDLSKAMGEFSKIVESVENEDDAKQAVAKIKELTKSVNDLPDRIKALGPIKSPEQLAKLANGDNLGGAGIAAMTSGLKAMANPKLPQEFRDAANDFFSTYTEVASSMFNPIDMLK